MNFGKALEVLKDGKKISLPHWQKDVFVSIQFPDKYSKMTHPYIYVTSRFGMIPWVITQVELLGENWMIVK